MESEDFSVAKPFENGIPGNVSGDFEGWEKIGYFGSYHLYSRENLRRIVEPGTGTILAQYILNENRGNYPQSQ